MVHQKTRIRTARQGHQKHNLLAFCWTPKDTDPPTTPNRRLRQGGNQEANAMKCPTRAVLVQWISSQVVAADREDNRRIWSRFG
jgi:hypothetical protein